MTLPNRVTPLGEVFAIPARGLFTGNRGIICLCDYKGWRRTPMAGRSWTELFFLDEATALAAGHRPCFLCRREAAEGFRAAWAKGNAVAPPKATAMDAV